MSSMMKESEEYLFEIKISNFKIVLTQLVEYIENLSVDEDDEDDKNNIINLGGELVKQYEIIINKIESFKEDIINITTNKVNLEGKIAKLNILLNDADMDINKLQELYDNEKDKHHIVLKKIKELHKKDEDYNLELHKIKELYKKDKDEHESDLKKLKEVTLKLQKTNEFAQELENLLKEKVDEVLCYKKKFEDLNNETEYPHLDTNKKSIVYFEKIIESNNKILQQKSEKIKNLEKENKDKFDQILDLQTIITKKDEYITEIENNISRLNKDYSEKINLKQCTNLENEILIEKYKEEMDCLKKENNNLKLQKNINDLEIPLIDNKVNDKVDKCSMCNIL